MQDDVQRLSIHKRKLSDSLNPNSLSSSDSGLGSVSLGGHSTMVGGHGVGQAVAAKSNLIEGDIRRCAINGDLQRPSIVSLSARIDTIKPTVPGMASSPITTASTHPLS